jgi:peptide subunit release factor RF-3
MCDCEKFSVANKRTGAARKAKSLKLMQAAIEELKESGIKPTIMQVAKILKGRLGETTIKKYWRIVNPKSSIDATASPVTINVCKYTEEQLAQSHALVINEECNKTVSDPFENFVELYIKEWNLKILKPKYFELLCNGNKSLGNMLYQRQFRPIRFY